MSHCTRFSTNSFFKQLDDSTIYILLKESIWKSAISLLIAALLLCLPWIIGSKEEDVKAKIIWTIIWTAILLFTCYNLFYYEKITLNLKNNTLLKIKCVAGIPHTKIKIAWPEGSYFINEYVYDSYGLAAVWLILKSNDRKNSYKLIKFTSEEQYKNFARLLKEKFPTFYIGEWHD